MPKELAELLILALAIVALTAVGVLWTPRLDPARTGDNGAPAFAAAIEAKDMTR